MQDASGRKGEGEIVTKLTREKRLAAREADKASASPVRKVVDVVLVEGQKARLTLPDGSVLVVRVEHAEGGYCRLAFTKGEPEE